MPRPRRAGPRAFRAARVPPGKTKAPEETGAFRTSAEAGSPTAMTEVVALVTPASYRRGGSAPERLLGCELAERLAAGLCRERVVDRSRPKLREPGLQHLTDAVARLTRGQFLGFGIRGGLVEHARPATALDLEGEPQARVVVVEVRGDAAPQDRAQEPELLAVDEVAVLDERIHGRRLP